MARSITVFAPATVANVGPGFDIFGFALEDIGDTITVSATESTNISITGGRHCESIPTDPTLNVAGVAVQAMLTHANKSGLGVNIHIEKNIIPGSGLGSSSSSASGSVFAVNELFSLGYSRHELIPFAMVGEGAGGGIEHADNVAPCLLGGFTIVRNYDPLDVIRLSQIPELYVAIVHPQIEVKTSISKRMLKKEIDMATAVKQWGNVAGMVAGLLENNYNLIGRSMEDHVAEPVRSMMIPGYEEIKALVKESGAIGASISGSGPSIFAFCKTAEEAIDLSHQFAEIYTQLDIENNIYQSRINSIGTTL